MTHNTQTTTDAVTAHMTADAAGMAEWLNVLIEAGCSRDDAIEQMAEMMSDGCIDIDCDWDNDDDVQAHQDAINDAVRAFFA